MNMKDKRLANEIQQRNLERIHLGKVNNMKKWVMFT